MKRLFNILMLFSVIWQLPAQESIARVLEEITQHNTTLAAIRERVNADKVGHQTGLLPHNPEVEFNFLWGQPADLGNRKDFSIRQTFDFPTVYFHKSQIAGIKMDQSELEYMMQRSEVLYQAKQLCLQLTFQNALAAELRRRKYYAQEVAQAYQQKFDMGQVGRLDYNKAQVHLLTVTKRMELSLREREALLSELIRLNGGNVIYFSDSVFTHSQLPINFDAWLAEHTRRNAELEWVDKELSVASEEVRLAKAQHLPEFFAGYMSETVVGQQFRGVTMGVTIPLWGNRNTVKYARAKSEAVRYYADDRQMQYRGEMLTLYEKALSLEKSIADFRLKLHAYSNNEMLKSAFDQGEISLSELVMELSAYYESYALLLEMELELGLTIAMMHRSMSA